MSHNYRAPPVPPRPRPTHPPYASSHEEPVHRPGPSRNSSTTTIRPRPTVQIPIPQIPSGAQPAINPASISAVTDSLQKTRIADNARPRHGSYAPPPPESYENYRRPNPYEQDGRLAAGPPLSPLSRSWSAEPGTSQLHLQPRTADGQPPRPMPGSRPRTDYENVGHAWGGNPQTSHVPGGKPWEGSAFTVGSHIDLGDDYEWDSGYGGSSQGHGGKGRVPGKSHDSHASGSGQQEWSKNRWGMDSETSFETASNAEQIGTGVLADQVSAAESGLDRLSLFHTGASLEFDEWAYVVPEEARDILDRDEIQRQSNIYELIKSERNFIISMQIFLYIFRDGLLYANPPIIPQRDKLERFVHEVFFNAQEILSIHLHLRDLLYERQRDQHPIIHSVADIYLRWLLEHKEPYTRFQKHLPKSFNYHKTELRHNASYRNFFNDISKILTDIRNAGMDDSSVPRLEDSTKPTLEFLIGRINKQDFDTFLHGFNTRFTRLELQFTTMAKRTAKDHPDVCGDSAPIPLITSTLKQVLRIASVELQTLQNRVEFENFCKKLHFRKGEIIDLDWYDEHRQLFMHGPLARRNRRDVEWHGWSDLYVGLLDNYLVVTKDVSSAGREQCNVVSRPIPLDYLRLAKPYNGPPETRRPEGCIIRDKLLGDSVQMYPFTLYHVADPNDRRYTFYTETEALRTQWLTAFNEAMIIRNTYQSENKFFAVNTLSGRRFNTKTVLVPSENITKFDWLGQVYAAAPFAFEGEHFILYSTNVGIYLGLRHRPEGIQKVMRFTEVTQMAALHSLEKIVLLANESLYAYPFQSLVRVWRREADMSELGVSGERLSRSRDGAVQFFRAGMCEGRMLIGYATKSIIHFHLHFLEALSEPVGSPVTATRGLMNKISTSTKESYSKSFPSFGQASYTTLTVPRDATDLAMLTKRIVVMCQSQVVIVDPRDPAMKTYPVPDFMVNPSVEYGSAEAISSLKDRCSKSKALGMVLSRSKELMIVYADFGCYVTKYGAPARQSAFVRWETRATSVAFRWPHALLFSPNYVEIRNVESGGLVQVIQERDVRLLYPGPPYQGPILAAMRGEDDARGKTDRVVELLETAPIEIEQGEPTDDTLWREWDV